MRGQTVLLRSNLDIPSASDIPCLAPGWCPGGHGSCVDPSQVRPLALFKDQHQYEHGNRRATCNLILEKCDLAARCVPS
jgi:hypothetical protein